METNFFNFHEIVLNYQNKHFKSQRDFCRSCGIEGVTTLNQVLLHKRNFNADLLFKILDNHPKLIDEIFYSKRNETTYNQNSFAEESPIYQKETEKVTDKYIKILEKENTRLENELRILKASKDN